MRVQETLKWFVYIRNEVVGPFTHAEMAHLAREGQLSQQAQATRRAPPDWKEAGADEMLAPIFIYPEMNRPLTAHSPLSADPGRLVVLPSRPCHEPGAVGTTGKPPLLSVDTPTTHAARRVVPAAGVTATTNTFSPWDKGRPAVERDRREFDNDDNPHPISSGLVSLVLPGLGQLMNGEVMKGIAFFIGALILWGVGIGWIVHLWAAIDAAHRAGAIAEHKQTLRIEASQMSARKK